MTIYPAIDLRNGKCVRLFQGKADAETVYFEDPLDPALSWKEQGAEFLHVVDLDGAFSGGSHNLSAVEQICLLYTSPSPRDKRQSRMPSSA